MEVTNPDDWAAGFIAGFALAKGMYPLYDERVEEFHAARKSDSEGKD